MSRGGLCPLSYSNVQKFVDIFAPKIYECTGKIVFLNLAIQYQTDDPIMYFLKEFVVRLIQSLKHCFDIVHRNQENPLHALKRQQYLNTVVT